LVAERRGRLRKPKAFVDIAEDLRAEIHRDHGKKLRLSKVDTNGTILLDRKLGELINGGCWGSCHADRLGTVSNRPFTS
jgi:hypothetical protein